MMKVLVATGVTNGSRPGDFTECVDGELVWIREPCDSSLRDPDGECGCGRSFAGMASHGLTTTAQVRELPILTRADYERALAASLEAQRIRVCCEHLVPELVDELIDLADSWPAGAIVECRIDVLDVRETVP